MDDGPPSPLPETSIQEPGTSSRTVRPEAPVDSMLKDMATIIFSTFLLAGWVAFVITYPKVSQTSPPSGLLGACNYLVIYLICRNEAMSLKSASGIKCWIHFLVFLSASYIVSSFTTECSQAAAATAPGVPETDGGEVGAASETAAVPPCRRGLGVGPRQRLSGGGPHSLRMLRPQQPKCHPPRLQPLQPVCVWAGKLCQWARRCR